MNRFIQLNNDLKNAAYNEIYLFYGVVGMFYINSVNGVKIAVYDLNSAGRDTMLMIHGWPLDQRIFEYQKQALMREGYRVVTMDLRGFGSSQVTAGGYTYDCFADDIYAVIRTMKLRSFILAGFSMGGAVCLRYMGRYHGYGVKKLVLLAAAAPCYTKRPGYHTV